jgi:hypothetical protein
MWSGSWRQYPHRFYRRPKFWRAHSISASAISRFGGMQARGAVIQGSLGLLSDPAPLSASADAAGQTPVVLMMPPPRALPMLAFSHQATQYRARDGIDVSGAALCGNALA